MKDHGHTVSRLKKERPKDWVLRASRRALFALVIGSWIVGDFGAGTMFSDRRWTNLLHFLHELWPYPLQSKSFDSQIFFQWIGKIMRTKGWEATITTLAISIAAIFISGCAGAILSLLAAKTLATDSPFLPALRSVTWPTRLFWGTVVTICRIFMIFVRSIPEYIWAFLFLAVLGPRAWPLVLALAVHNTGILGRLGAEVVENTESPPLTALRALGASRSQMSFYAFFPISFSRFLLFFLYRWEICVREATVLGMLGISSLGFWIHDARARNHYDEMFFLILLGGMLVVLGDILSATVREWVRRQS
jgi:phosphonate transport system permease protein